MRKCWRFKSNSSFWWNKWSKFNLLRAIPLFIDYELELPEEKARIIMSEGGVEQDVDELGLPSGPFRVYSSGKEYPGLAMSRSIGDLITKTLGVIPEPGIMEYDLNKNTDKNDSEDEKSKFQYEKSDDDDNDDKDDSDSEKDKSDDHDEPKIIFFLFK